MNERIATSQRRLEEATKMKEGPLKFQTDLGKKRKSTIEEKLM